MEYYKWVQRANQRANEGVCIAGGYTAKSAFANAVQSNTDEAEGYGDIDEDFYR
ncbi:MAG: hypothetical protein LBM93_02840 [Oscillospiraceae bacterium]|jgi:hypothetical protein|nr:hypothetical protein [Oscillospiraceae bacterium]